MADNKRSSAIIDAVLKLLVTSGSLGVVLVAPNVMQALDKPLARFFKTMDRRQQERELRRVLYYMKKQNLVKTTDNYEHGLTLTDKGRKRYEQINLDEIKIEVPQHWDKKWRIVFFDIPEKYKPGRDALTRKLKELGFYPLQRSVFVHPYPCREEIQAVTANYAINKYVSYIETSHIDQEKILIKKFHPKT